VSRHRTALSGVFSVMLLYIVIDDPIRKNVTGGGTLFTSRTIMSYFSEPRVALV